MSWQIKNAMSWLRLTVYISQSIGWLDNINVILCCQNMTYNPLYELSIKIKFVILIIVWCFETNNSQCIRRLSSKWLTKASDFYIKLVFDA